MALDCPSLEQSQMGVAKKGGERAFLIGETMLGLPELVHKIPLGLLYPGMLC